MDNSTKLSIVRTSLFKMFNGKHFDVCTVRNICDLLGIHLPKETDSGMRLVHCVDWEDMETDTRLWIKSEIERLLSDPSLIKSNYVPNVLGIGSRMKVLSPHFKNSAMGDSDG